MKPMKILVACEESQEVCKAFRARGHEAYSNDLIECSGGHPEWHLQMDVFEAIKLKNWNMMIAFPPCTYLTVTANKWYKPEFESRWPARKQNRSCAKIFFLSLTKTTISKWAIENPVGIMSTEYRKPTQIIQPFYFGHKESKKTCLWLHGLPKLNGTNLVEPEYLIAAGKRYSPTHYNPIKRVKNNLDMLAPNLDMLAPSLKRSKIRSKTFPGIAKAMAEQWSPNLNP